LTHGLRSFSRLRKPLFIYGHSLAESDEHILRRIEDGRVSRLYVSLYGAPETETNQAAIARAEEIVAKRPASKPIVVRFFDAASAGVWG
jgi:hypothetical protein